MGETLMSSAAKDLLLLYGKPVAGKTRKRKSIFHGESKLIAWQAQTAANGRLSFHQSADFALRSIFFQPAPVISPGMMASDGQNQIFRRYLHLQDCNKNSEMQSKLCNSVCEWTNMHTASLRENAWRSCLIASGMNIYSN